MIYTFKGHQNLSNTYLICRYDECFLIDPSHAYEEIMQKLAGKKLLGIILTHAHADHFLIIDQFNVAVYIHTLDYDLLFMPRYNGLNNQQPINLSQIIPQRLNNNDKIKIADQFFKIIHTPGHTKGSICIEYGNAIFTGDLIFKNGVGRSDLYSGSTLALNKSIKLILSHSANIKLYPGHDDITTIKEERKNLNYKKQ